MSDEDRRLPLSGIRVLDCSRVLAGPFATMLLADLGADVIKLEPPGGDETRLWGPPWWGDPSERRSAYFAAVNRNKRSVVVDLRTDPGRRVLDRLAADAHLLVHNHRPSTAARLGLGPDGIPSGHPDLVVASVGGFPGDSEERERPAYDLLAQAVSGHMAITGEPGARPVRLGVALLDLLAGLEVALGAVAALLGRRGGSGVQTVEVSLVESAVIGLANVLGNHLADGAEPGRHGSAHPNIVPYQAFAARDGDVVIAAGTDDQFAALLRVLGLRDDEGRYAANADRVHRRDELIPWLTAATGQLGREELLSALDAADIPAGPVRGVGEALAAMERATPDGWLQRADGIAVAPSPVRVDGERLPLRRPPPMLGAHTEEVLAEVGLGSAERRALRLARITG